MKMMNSLRRVRVPTKSGHVLIFDPGEPRAVPDAAVVDAQKYGCVVVDDSGTVAPEESSKVSFDYSGDLRKSVVYMAVKEMIKENTPSDFDAGGNPKAAVVSERIGVDITAGEVRDAFRMYQRGQSENREIELSTEAQNVLRVVHAEGKRELADLAKEFGFDDAEVKGMTARSLRQRLMRHFTGMVVG